MLNNFSLILDLSLGSISARLIQCVLGWHTVKEVVHVRQQNKNCSTKEKGVHATTLISGMSLETYDKFTEYLKKDVELYGMS